MRLIDADALAKEIAGRIEESEENMEFGQVEGLEGAWCCVDNAPTIDAVPVVRCGECQWWDAVEGTKIGYCLANSHGVNKDWYCADGERKKEDD